MANLDQFISSAARRYNLDVPYLSSFVEQESTGNPSAVNRAGGGQGAWGAMQVRGAALQAYNAANGTNYKLSDLLNPAVGIDVGAWYLNQQLDRFGDPQKAAIAYNEGAGSPSVAKGSTPYSQSIMSRVNTGYGGAPDGSSQSGVPAAQSAQGAGADVLAKFGFSSDGKPAQPAQKTTIPDVSSTQNSTPTNPDPGTTALAKFGFGADGQPMKQAAQPAQAVIGVSQQNPAGTVSTGAVMGESRTPVSITPPPPPSDGPHTPAEKRQIADFNAQTKQRTALKTLADTSDDGSNTFGAGVVHGANNLLNAGFQTAAHVAKTGANTFLSPTNPLNKAANAWADAEDQNATQSAQNAPHGFAGKAGTFVGETLPTMLIPGGTVAKAIVGGALVGAAQPVTENAGQNFYAQKGMQAGLGAATGGMAHGIISGVGNAFAPKAAEGVTLVRNMLQPGEKVSAPTSNIPGVVPTLAESTGNLGIANLQQAVTRQNPAPFAARTAENAEARGSVASSLTGTKDDLIAAITARAEQSAPLYSAANGENFQADEALNGILSRPSAQSAIARAKKLAAEGGQPLRPGVDMPNADGSGSYSGRALNYIKQGIDDNLTGGASEGIGANERRAITGTKNALLDWMDAHSETYANARQTYQSLSQPIEQMQYLQGANLTDAQGNLTLAKVDGFIKRTEKARTDPTNAASSLTDDQMKSLYALRDSMRAESAAAKPVGNLGGSSTAQNLQQNHLFQFQEPVVPVANMRNALFTRGAGTAAGAAVGGLIGSPVLGGLAGNMIGEVVGNALLRRQLAKQAGQQSARVHSLTNLLLNPSEADLAAINANQGYLRSLVGSATRAAVNSAPAVGAAGSNALMDYINR